MKRMMKASFIALTCIIRFSTTVWSFETASRSLLFQRQQQSAVAFKQPRQLLERTSRSTKLQSSILTTAAAAADTFWRTSPYTAALLVCGFKGAASDFIAQKIQQKKMVETGDSVEMIVVNTDGSFALKPPLKKHDFRRTFSYMLYGALYLGLGLEYSYNHIYPRIFGVGRDLATVASKVAFDMLFHSTFFTLPIAYLIKAVVFQYSFAEAIQRYVDDVLHHKLLLKYYSLWIPVMVVAFGIIPAHFRVTFVAMVSFFWLIILSSIASKKRLDDDDEECTLIDGTTCNMNK